MGPKNGCLPCVCADRKYKGPPTKSLPCLASPGPHPLVKGVSHFSSQPFHPHTTLSCSFIGVVSPGCPLSYS